MDHPAQPLVAVSSVHQQDMRSPVRNWRTRWLVKRIFRCRRPEDELISVGDDAPLHGQVGNVHMHRYPVLRSASRIPNGLGDSCNFSPAKRQTPVPGRYRRILRMESRLHFGESCPVEHRVSMVLYLGVHSIMASWLPVSFLIRRNSSASSAQAMTLQWHLTEAPFGMRLVRYISVHSWLTALLRLYFDNESILREFFHHLQDFLRASSMNTYCE